MPEPVLDFRIDATQSATRELAVDVEFDVRDPGRPTQQVFQPTWTPGSYLIREYSRHLGRVAASDATTGAALVCRKTAKNRFEIALPAGTRRVRITYRVYAHELSVRTADATIDHAFWNHACLLLWPVGEPDRAARIHVDHPRHWRLACSLRGDGERELASGTRRTTLAGRDLDEVMDAPCLVGSFDRVDFDVDGVPHAVVLDGLAAITPPATLVQDLQKVVRTARAVFGGPLPYASYLFLCLFAADGHGGLEHTASTTLLSSRTAWTSGKGYREFLGLAAHELFHAWNVKRMRPVEFWRYDYEVENYTELLWLIEGWTAYYDDLICQRARLLPREDYLGILAKTITTMLGAPGRLRASLRESSFDAWIRLYRPDENTRNSSQNYYGNGSIAALCTDLAIRRATDGARSLDDVVRGLYRRSFESGRGYTMDDVRAVVRDVAGAATIDLLDRLVGGVLEPDLAATFGTVGVRFALRDTERPYLGVVFDSASTRIASVTVDSPAHRAGLAPGDEILALQDLRVDAGRWQEVLDATARIDGKLEILLARRGVITRATVTPSRSPGSAALELDNAASPGQIALRDGWLTADEKV